jgi:hypothetical protein
MVDLRGVVIFRWPCIQDSSVERFSHPLPAIVSPLIKFSSASSVCFFPCPQIGVVLAVVMTVAWGRCPSG